MSDLTTLANVKSWLNVQTTTDDVLFARLISAISAYVQSWLNRNLLSASYTDKMNGNDNAAVILFNNYPVTAVTSLTISGTAIPFSPDGIQSGYVFDSKCIFLIGYRSVKGLQNVVVNYTAGHTTVPLELEQAVIDTIALRYRERTRIGENSKSIGGETVSFSTKDFSPAVQTILNNYKRVISTY